MSAPVPRPRRLPRSPVVFRDGRWWLVSGAGSIPASDPAFTAALDDFAQAMAAADRTVEGLRPRRNESASAPGGRR